MARAIEEPSLLLFALWTVSRDARVEVCCNNASPSGLVQQDLFTKKPVTQLSHAEYVLGGRCQEKTFTTTIDAKTAFTAARISGGLPKMKLGPYPHKRLYDELADKAVSAEAARRDCLTT